MNALPPLLSLFDAPLSGAREIALPPEILRVYGHLRLPAATEQPYVIGNFVTTLDGVVSLDVAGHSGGGDISGNSEQDHMVMGILRAVADAVIVGAGTLRDASRHLWTAQYVYAPFASAYQALRTSLGKSSPPLNVIVTAHGELDPSLPVFQSGKVPVLIVTTTKGAQHLRTLSFPPAVQIAALPAEQALSARTILEAVSQVQACDIIVCEGGPHLIGDFFAEHCLHEQFLTLAPQIAGRDATDARPGLVAGKLFAPDHPLWGTLISVKQGGSHLFLRYTFA